MYVSAGYGALNNNDWCLILWNVPLNGVASSPAVANGVVYVTTGEIYALDASSGAVLWSEQASGDSSPALANGVVHATSSGVGCAFSVK